MMTLFAQRFTITSAPVALGFHRGDILAVQTAEGGRSIMFLRQLSPSVLDVRALYFWESGLLLLIPTLRRLLLAASTLLRAAARQL